MLHKHHRRLLSVSPSEPTHHLLRCISYDTICSGAYRITPSASDHAICARCADEHFVITGVTRDGIHTIHTGRRVKVQGQKPGYKGKGQPYPDRKTQHTCEREVRVGFRGLHWALCGRHHRTPVPLPPPLSCTPIAPCTYDRVSFRMTRSSSPSMPTAAP